MQRCAVRASRLGQLAGARRLASTSKIVWTYTDEAPARRLKTIKEVYEKNGGDLCGNQPVCRVLRRVVNAP